MIGTEWWTHAFDLEPLAPRTGPFPGRDFLSTWWQTMAADGDTLLLAEADGGLLPAMLRNGVVEFVGDGDVTDYHSPLGPDPAGPVGALAAAVAPGTRFRFDSLPGEAADAMEAVLAAHAVDVVRTNHEIAAVLPLPADFDDYLMAIGKKERHETRRKRRRFAAELGEPHLERREGAGAVREFAEMHRYAAGDKGEFMTEDMEELFIALHEWGGAVLDVLVGDAGRPVAAAVGFEDASGYYLYNSAYDPAASHASPGVVLVSMLIETAIAAGRSVFDFLKGDETYKFRLGAEPRPLYVIEGSFGTTS
jgi:CelD/BcsL family acetyltransferase involved in cellulose biosynthesis